MERLLGNVISAKHIQSHNQDYAVKNNTVEGDNGTNGLPHDGSVVRVMESGISEIYKARDQVYTRITAQ